MKPATMPRRRCCAGATTIEFALGLLIFLTFALGIMDFARMLFTWNAAGEVTRDGARYAAVSDDMTKQAEVLAQMQQLLPQIEEIEVQWSRADGVACTPSTCEGVTVGIKDLDYQWISPIAGAVAPLIPMPKFSTYLPREVMRKDPHSGAICP